MLNVTGQRHEDRVNRRKLINVFAAEQSPHQPQVQHEQQRRVQKGSCRSAFSDTCIDTERNKPRPQQEQRGTPPTLEVWHSVFILLNGETQTSGSIQSAMS